MSKSAVIIAAVAASITFASVAHANSDSEPVCGYDQVCETTTSVATDEPPVPTTVPSTIGAINGPADVPTTVFVCPGSFSGDVCLPPFEPRVLPPATTLLQPGDDCMDDGTTRWSIQPCDTIADVGTAELPATGSPSATVALIGLVLLALAGLLYGVRWVFRR